MSNNCCDDINFCYTVLTSSKEGHTKSSESAPDWICQILYAVQNLQAIIAVYRLNSDVERYLSPVSGKRTTMVLPSYSGLFASSVAA